MQINGNIKMSSTRPHADHVIHSPIIHPYPNRTVKSALAFRTHKYPKPIKDIRRPLSALMRLQMLFALLQKIADIAVPTHRLR